MATTKEAAELMIAGMPHVGGTEADQILARRYFDEGDYDRVRVFYEEFEEDMWRETREDKDRVRGRHHHG